MVNYRGILTVILLISMVSISIIPISVSAQETRQIPFVIYGYVYDEETHETVQNVIVYAENKRTGDIISTVTNDFGQYSIDVLNFNLGVKNGDIVKIVAKYGNLSAYTETTILEDEAGEQINLYLYGDSTPDSDTSTQLTSDTLIGIMQIQNNILIVLALFVVVLMSVMIFNNIRINTNKPKL